MSQSKTISSLIAAQTLAVLAAATLTGCNFASTAMNGDGVRLYAQGNGQAASARFMQAIANDPTKPDGYYNLAATLHQSGRLHNRQQDLEQAENYYNQCLDRDPNHIDCYRGLAVLLADTGRSDAALRLIEGWSTRSPSSPNPKIEMARLLEEMGEPEKAKARLEEAITVEPTNARALAALGRLREQSGDHMQALANYERSLSANQFQPHLAARAANLQTAVGATSPRPTTSSNRVVRRPLPTSRY